MAKGKRKGLTIKHHAVGEQKSRAKGRIPRNFNGYKTLGGKRGRRKR
jgi:hypothetical protein